MTEHSLWRFSRALHRAINERQQEDLEALIDDDVDWAIYGPIDMFPFLGARRGKEAVLEVVRQIADNVRVRRFDRETIMLGVDSASSMLRYSLTMLDSSKPISLR
ncbi:MAG TPA: nuclear transport factor 2 family protein, partial [Bradyrhizobium sp.]